MNSVDVVLSVLLLVSVALGAWRGFLYEVLSLVAWVAAFVAARWFAEDAAAQLPLQGASAPLRYAAGFVVVFVAAAFAGGLLAWLVRKLAEGSGLRPVDRALGAVFGGIRAVFWLVLLVMVVGLTPWASHPEWVSSTGVRWLDVVAQQVKTWWPEDLMKVLS